MEKKNRTYPGLGSASPLAAALRKYRMLAGFSQREVATILQMNRSTYTYYETGKTAPDPQTLNRIAKIFGVSMEVFFVDSDGPALKLSDSGTDPVRKRANRIRRPNPQRVGDLTSAEKEVIAFLRDKELPPETALRSLRDIYDEDYDQEDG